jgi:carboxypeptidase family protein
MIGFFLLIAAQIAVRGTVVSAESREPLDLSIVALQPGFAQRFTDRGGNFAFDGAQPGRYLLTVRQIGYAPLDTQLVVAGDTTTSVQIVLHHLAIELPPVTIAASQCTKPGPPDSSDAAVHAVFDQLQENARRFELLADSYPFRYTLELSERLVTQRGDTGPPVVRRLEFSSRDNRTHPYAVGRVVERAWWPWGSGDTLAIIHSADLDDLGNPAFIANHCFHLAGRDTIGGRTFVRLDFEPAIRIGSADMAGAVYLDSLTYELRYTKTSLTRPGRSALRDVSSVSFRTRFRNIAPHIPLQDSLSVTTTYVFGQGAKVETQRTTQVRFRRQPPPP